MAPMIRSQQFLCRSFCSLIRCMALLLLYMYQSCCDSLLLRPSFHSVIYCTYVRLSIEFWCTMKWSGDKWPGTVYRAVYCDCRVAPVCALLVGVCRCPCWCCASSGSMSVFLLNPSCYGTALLVWFLSSIFLLSFTETSFSRARILLLLTFLGDSLMCR